MGVSPIVEDVLHALRAAVAVVHEDGSGVAVSYPASDDAEPRYGVTIYGYAGRVNATGAGPDLGELLRRMCRGWLDRVHGRAKYLPAVSALRRSLRQLKRPAKPKRAHKYDRHSRWRDALVIGGLWRTRKAYKGRTYQVVALDPSYVPAASVKPQARKWADLVNVKDAEAGRAGPVVRISLGWLFIAYIPLS